MNNNINFKSHGDSAYNLAHELWPINRSLTGEGVRKTLDILKREITELKIKTVPSGFKAYDWKVPQEWKVNSAWIETPDGEKICEFSKNNLHLVGYSKHFKGSLTLAELQNHLHSIEDNPNAIPYVTSYYQSAWGFCIKQNDRNKLKKGVYKVNVDTNHFDGELNYGEIVIKGKSKKEVLFSTYICHPSMGNNELSGPLVSQALVKIINKNKNNFFTYRFIFIPETIGAIVYIKKNLKFLKKNLKAGFVITCVGDEGEFSYIPSRYGNTYADKLAKNILQESYPNFKQYSFLDRGSDERQFCSPKIDLPVCSVTKTKYGTFKEYHTSDDNLNFISSKGLSESIEFYLKIILLNEKNAIPEVKTFCEPQLGKSGLYSHISKSGSSMKSRDFLNVVAYSNGHDDLIKIAKKINYLRKRL